MVVCWLLVLKGTIVHSTGIDNVSIFLLVLLDLFCWLLYILCHGFLLQAVLIFGRYVCGWVRMGCYLMMGCIP